MTGSVQEALAPLLSAEDGDERLLNFIDPVSEAVVLQDSGLETVTIQRDAAGSVVLATSVKLPNLRFRLGDLLLEAAGSGLSIAGALDQPLALVVTGLRFLRTVRGLAALAIREEDAQMLIAIYRLAQEERRVQAADLPALLPSGWDEARVARALERLELLACIELRMEGIVLNETIIVQRLD